MLTLSLLLLGCDVVSTLTFPTSSFFQSRFVSLIGRHWSATCFVYVFRYCVHLIYVQGAVGERNFNNNWATRDDCHHNPATHSAPL